MHPSTLRQNFIRPFTALPTQKRAFYSQGYSCLLFSSWLGAGHCIWPHFYVLCPTFPHLLFLISSNLSSVGVGSLIVPATSAQFTVFIAYLFQHLGCPVLLIQLLKSFLAPCRACTITHFPFFTHLSSVTLVWYFNLQSPGFIVKSSNKSQQFSFVCIYKQSCLGRGTGYVMVRGWPWSSLIMLQSPHFIIK